MYRQAYNNRIVELQCGEMLPLEYQFSKYYYAFDQEKWLSCERPWGPVFYSMSNLEIDKHEIQMLGLIKTLLCNDMEAVAFYYRSNGSFVVVKD